MEQPHTAADAIPASTPGALLALADRFDLLMAMFALGAKPTGSSDPYGLRRAALGVMRILREQVGGGALASLSVRDGLTAAAARLREQGVEVPDEALDAAEEFVVGRFAQLLRDEGVSAGFVQAVLPGAGSPGRATGTLADPDRAWPGTRGSATWWRPCSGSTGSCRRARRRRTTSRYSPSPPRSGSGRP